MRCDAERNHRNRRSRSGSMHRSRSRLGSICRSRVDLVRFAGLGVDPSRFIGPGVDPSRFIEFTATPPHRLDRMPLLVSIPCSAGLLDCILSTAWTSPSTLASLIEDAPLESTGSVAVSLNRSTARAFGHLLRSNGRKTTGGAGALRAAVVMSVLPHWTLALRNRLLHRAEESRVELHPLRRAAAAAAAAQAASPSDGQHDDGGRRAQTILTPAYARVLQAVMGKEQAAGREREREKMGGWTSGRLVGWL